MTGIVECLGGGQTGAKTPVSFLSLASELRNKIYESLLLQEDPVHPWSELYRSNDFTSGLLCVSKTVHREASSMLYGHNRFDFSDTTPEKLGLFLEQIGNNNVSYIRHIVIEFPDVLCMDRCEVSLGDAMRILDTIRAACANVTVITTCLYSTNSMERRLDRLDNLKVATEALALVDTHFRSIPSVQKIILEVYEDAPSEVIRKKMESHGWVTHKVEYEEEEDEGWDRAFSDFEYDHDGYDYDSTGHDFINDDYDNDSDFWRRAAD